MVKKTIILIALIFAGFLSFPVRAYAQECTSRITKTGTYDGNPEVTIQLLNAGVENADTLRIASTQFSSAHLICPLGFSANSTNPQSVTCSISSRHLELNELNKITLSYTGSGATYGTIQTGGRYPSSNGSTNRNNWTDPGKLYVADNDYGYIDIPYPNPQYTGQSYAQFGSFNIPTNATITGISIETKGFTNNTSGGRQLTLGLTRDSFTTEQQNGTNNDLMWINPGSFVGQDHTYTTQTGAGNFDAYNWVPDDFNNDNFALEIYGNDNTNTRFSVDYIRVKVSYKTLDPSCFTAYINSVQCSEFLGTLCPTPETGGVVVPKTCDPLNYFCQFQQWAYSTFLYWFGFDEEFSQEQFASLYSYLGYKFPFGYLTPLASAGFGTPIGSPSAELASFNIGFTPKMVQSGNTTDLTPVTLDVPGSTFAPVKPFLGYLRGFLSVVILFSTGLFIVMNAGRFFG